MAERRMFSKKIIDSDDFLDMPLSTQALYFHLSMRADDDGFLNNPKKILRMIGGSQNELELLLAKNFIFNFDTGVVVIKHWKIHNYIRGDRYKETMHKKEKSLIIEGENKEYELLDNSTDNCLLNGIPSDNQTVYQMDTQDRLGKDRLGKDSIILSKDKISSKDLLPIIEKWNSLGLKKLISIKTSTNRHKLLNARIKEYGLDSISQAIDNIRKSDFLRGQNNRGWIITFDWLIRPNNFVKVLEGNYDNKESDKDARYNKGNKNVIEDINEELFGE